MVNTNNEIVVLDFKFITLVHFHFRRNNFYNSLILVCKSERDLEQRKKLKKLQKGILTIVIIRLIDVPSIVDAITHTLTTRLDGIL